MIIGVVCNCNLPFRSVSWIYQICQWHSHLPFQSTNQICHSNLSIAPSTGDLNFEFNDLQYDSDEEIKRMYSKKTKVILGTSKQDTWKKALLKTQGFKVKDDKKLIEKTKKRKLKLKQKSSLKWKERLKAEKERQERRQNRRERNINKRIENKKEKRMKRRMRK